MSYTRTNGMPLWQTLENIQGNQERILTYLDKFNLNLDNLGIVLEKLSEIASKTDKAIEAINKININRLEQTLTQLDSKIPKIEPLLKELDHVIKATKQIGNELGIEVQNGR